ncbi:MAG: PRD domain-containing protein [Spirochaetes bacterium]|nr:PRD domain-containing protein [Spirochaetota bacterium]
MDSLLSVSTLSPRLARLLDLLLRSKEPLKVDAISQALGVSRRTVFRELENLRQVLLAANSDLLSVTGKGIVFSGNEKTRENLLELLSTHSRQPASKQERLLRLLIELVDHDGDMKKLSYYANILDVSESTISGDLDELESWLAAKGISLSRKSGIGVGCAGAEANLRAALVSRFMLDGDTKGKSYTSVFDFPGDDIETGVRRILQRKSKEVQWMTGESLCFFAIYLMVMVERVYCGKTNNAEQAPDAGQLPLAEEIAGEVSKEFMIELSVPERYALASWIQSCRSKNDSPADPKTDEAGIVQSLTMQMIDRFDPPIAAILKTNEQFVRLLSRHLQAMLIRLKGGKFLPNPLEKELRKNYPEVYEKTQAAAKVLQEHTGTPVSSNEVSFIQIHFLAALAFLGDRNIRRRFLRAGIVCISGIGTSYMLAYQLRQRFKGEMEVEVTDYNRRASWAAFDFLISTIPIEDASKPFVHVQTLLEEKDFQKIQKTINTFAFSERPASQAEHSQPLEQRLDAMLEIFMHSRKLLYNFAVESIAADCSFDELVRFAAERFAPGNPQKVSAALKEREKAGSQVVFELQIVFLHSRNAYIETPVFALIIPKGGVFSEIYLKQTKSCVLMLLPESAPKEISDLMGALSGALISRPPFLQAVCAGDKAAVQSVLEQEISELLFCCGRKLSGEGGNL